MLAGLLILVQPLYVAASVSVDAHGNILRLAVNVSCSVVAPASLSRTLPCLAAHSTSASGDTAAAWVSNPSAGLPLRLLEPLQGCAGAKANSIRISGTDETADGVCLALRGGCPFAEKAALAEKLGCAALLIADNAGVELSPPGLGDAQAKIPVAMIQHEDGAALLADTAQQVQLRIQVTGGGTDLDSTGISSATGTSIAGGVGIAVDSNPTLGEHPQDMIRYRRKASLGLTSLQRQCVERFAASPRLRPVRVIEGLMFNNELDMLELHLEELYDAVDAFVLVESGQTHQGREKPLHFGRNKKRFARFLDKIEHVVVERFPFECVQRCNCENYQRNAMMQGVERLSLALDPPLAGDDLLLVSDIDEILRHEVVRGLARCDVPMPAYFHLDFFYYSFHYQNRWTSDRSGAMTRAQQLSGMTPQHVRLLNQTFRAEVADAGWHCSYFGGVDMIINKLHSNCQTEYAGPPWDNRERIARVLEAGEDLFERKSEALVHIKGCAHAPSSVALADKTHPFCKYVY